MRLARVGFAYLYHTLCYPSQAIFTYCRTWCSSLPPKRNTARRMVIGWPMPCSERRHAAWFNQSRQLSLLPGYIFRVIQTRHPFTRKGYSAIWTKFVAFSDTPVTNLALRLCCTCAKLMTQITTTDYATWWWCDCLDKLTSIEVS